VPGSVPAKRAVARFLTRAKLCPIAVAVTITVAAAMGGRADHVSNVVEVVTNIVEVVRPASDLIEIIITPLRVHPLGRGLHVIDDHAAPALCGEVTLRQNWHLLA
jgi:hypothetical protein